MTNEVVLRQKAVGGDPASMRELGQLLLKDGDSEGAERWLTKGAEAGDFLSMGRLGEFYRDRDKPDQALHWYAQFVNGAEDAWETHAFGTWAYGAWRLADQLGEDRDVQITYLRKAAKSLHPEGTRQLGILLGANTEEGKEVLLTAADLGCANALTALGNEAEKIGDEEVAVKWYKKAATAGDNDAARALKQLYRARTLKSPAQMIETACQAVKKDYPFKALQALSDSGNPWASLMLGQRHMRDSSPLSYEDAQAYFDLAAQQGLLELFNADVVNIPTQQDNLRCFIAFVLETEDQNTIDLYADYYGSSQLTIGDLLSLACECSRTFRVVVLNLSDGGNAVAPFIIGKAVLARSELSLNNPSGVDWNPYLSKRRGDTPINDAEAWYNLSDQRGFTGASKPLGLLADARASTRKEGKAPPPKDQSDSQNDDSLGQFGVFTLILGTLSLLNSIMLFAGSGLSIPYILYVLRIRIPIPYLSLIISMLLISVPALRFGSIARSQRSAKVLANIGSIMAIISILLHLFLLVFRRI